MKQDIKDFVRISERLISLAAQTDELSEDECQILDYYVTELQRKVHPLCLHKSGTIALPGSNN
jgi:hypothetical protein